MNWSDAEITIGGVKMPAGEIFYGWNREPDYGVDMSSFYPSEVTFETTVAVDIEAFAGLFPRKPHGASELTLAKRVKYGGRKGRSALRRLLGSALPIELTTVDWPPVRMHGKAVFLSEREIMIEMRGRRGWAKPGTHASPSGGETGGGTP